MAGRIFNVEVDQYTAERLAHHASRRHVDVQSLAVEALSLFVIREDQTPESQDWSAEDLAAIQEGFEQLDRGEGVSQDVVEREIEELLRS